MFPSRPRVYPEGHSERFSTQCAGVHPRYYDHHRTLFVPIPTRPLTALQLRSIINDRGSLHFVENKSHIRTREWLLDKGITAFALFPVFLEEMGTSSTRSFTKTAQIQLVEIIPTL